MNILTNNTLKEMVEAIKAGTVTVIRNENNHVIGIGVNKPNLKVSDVRYVKQVSGGQVVGNTLEELEADEAALREFAASHNSYEYMQLAQVADTLAKLSDNDVEALVEYIEAHQEVRTVERRVEVPARSSGEFKGLTDDDLANYLTVDELKAIRNRANREGDLTVKNTARRALRRKGVEA